MSQDISKLVDETIKRVSADTIIQSSREVVFAWLNQGYRIETNLKTGKPDTKYFCEKIYSNFGNLLVPQEKNPYRFKGFATVDKDGPSKVAFPEQLKAARGMKAVFKWLNENIDSVIHTDVSEARINKKVTRVLAEILHLSNSDLLTSEERSTISKLHVVVFNRYCKK